MEEAHRKLDKSLKSSGYSLTNPRLVVLDYLLNKEPLTVGTLTKALAPQIDRASVYRTIALFQMLGIVQRHNVGLKYKIELSDLFKDHHHHFTCVCCGTMTPMNEQAMERFVDKLASHYGFKPTEHQIEIQGYCASCRREPATLKP